MKVRELIDYLFKCDPDMNVVMEYSAPIEGVVEYVDHVNPENSRVSIE